MDFKEQTLGDDCLLNTYLMASASIRSFAFVPVPWAMTESIFSFGKAALCSALPAVQPFSDFIGLIRFLPWEIQIFSSKMAVGG